MKLSIFRLDRSHPTSESQVRNIQYKYMISPKFWLRKKETCLPFFANVLTKGHNAMVIEYELDKLDRQFLEILWFKSFIFRWENQN